MLLHGNELNIVKFQVQVLDRFLDQIAVLVSDVFELGRRYLDDQDLAVCVAVARRLEPRLIRVAVDFLFERLEDASPGVRGGSSNSKSHSSLLRLYWAIQIFLRRSELAPKR